MLILKHYHDDKALNLRAKENWSFWLTRDKNKKFPVRAKAIANRSYTADVLLKECIKRASETSEGRFKITSWLAYDESDTKIEMKDHSWELWIFDSQLWECTETPDKYTKIKITTNKRQKYRGDLCYIN